MITDLCIIGRCGDIIEENYRYIEIERPVPVNGKFVVDKIPVRYWNCDINGYFYKIKNGIVLGIRGRIETDEHMGLVVVAEEITTMGSGDVHKVLKE